MTATPFSCIQQSLHPDIDIRVEFIYPEGCLMPEQVS
jgi:hypothetical protein